MKDTFVLGGVEFSSRLILGSGKYRDDRQIPNILKRGGIEMITVALRRVDLGNPGHYIIHSIPKDTVLIPNTSGARDAEEAVRLARMGRAAGCGDWVKIEIMRDQRYLMPDGAETIKATKALAQEGFQVLPYMNPDLYVARALQEAGAAAVMPLGAPIGSNRGLQTKELIRILIEEIEVPIIVDAGIGAPSHASEAMEMGADACMINTAIASSPDAAAMAEAFQYAVRAGRLAYLSGLSKTSRQAVASSPLTGFLYE